MARKRSTPKPPAASPPAIPFPDDAPDQPAEALFDLLATVASASGAVRLRRLVLIRSAVDIHPDGPVEGLNTLGMGPPEVRFQHDDEDGILQVVCTCRLDALRGQKGTGRKKRDDADPLATIEASFLAVYDVASRAFDEEELDAFCATVAVNQIWPYWRDFVRDVSTRAGLPVIDVPFDVVL